MGSIYRTTFTRVLYMERISQPVLAGILTALVGFTSSSAVVLTGLRAVGATPSEATPGRGAAREHRRGPRRLARRDRGVPRGGRADPGHRSVASARRADHRDPDPDRAGDAGRGGARALPRPGARLRRPPVAGRADRAHLCRAA